MMEQAELDHTQSTSEDQGSDLHHAIQIPLWDVPASNPSTPTSGLRATKVNKVHPSPGASPKAAPVDEPTRGQHELVDTETFGWGSRKISASESKLSSSPTSLQDSGKSEGEQQVGYREVPIKGIDNGNDNGNGIMNDGETPTPIVTPSSQLQVNGTGVTVTEWRKPDPNGVVKHRSLAKPAHPIIKPMAIADAEGDLSLPRKPFKGANPRQGTVARWMSRIVWGGRNITEAAWGAPEVKGILISTERRLEREYNPELKVSCLYPRSTRLERWSRVISDTLTCIGSAVCDAAGSTFYCPRRGKA